MEGDETSMLGHRRVDRATCAPAAHDPGIDVCSFGARQAGAAATIALVGDSHAQHWRPAVDGVARAKHWFAYSVALGGCPYSTATRVIPEPLRLVCKTRNALVPDWFAEHPEVHTVFLAQIAGVEWDFPPGTDQFEGQVQHYLEAWAQIPPTVTRVIILRDTPKAERGTRSCIRSAISRHQDAGIRCRVPRSVALTRDPAVEAMRRLGSPRFEVVDLTRDFCDARWCYPVIGGALVQKDVNHLTPVFVATLTPYLLRAVG
jgi:SGNH domain (fused to AT3 domains)